jgi:hypothetical protein
MSATQVGRQLLQNLRTVFVLQNRYFVIEIKYCFVYVSFLKQIFHFYKL